MSTGFYIIAGICLFLYYYFILRKYNRLGFRLFSLFTFVALFVGYWVFSDYRTEKAVKEHGQVIPATIVAKDLLKSKSTSSPDYAITILAKDRRALTINKYISLEEWTNWHVGQEIDLYQIDNADSLVAKISFDRFVKDSWILYLFPCFLFLIGLCCLYFLRNYRVGVDETTGAEWLEKDGKIYLDERNNAVASGLKKLNIISKMAQMFAR